MTEANGGVATGTTSPVTFTGLARGKWYKAKGQNCGSASHTNCSALTGFTSAIELPAAAGTTTASLSPDPATATFRNVATEWHTFTVSSTENVNVVANPGSGTPTLVLWPSDPRGADQCGFIENDDRRSRSNGQSIYIAGCAAGYATVELRKVSDNSVLRTYTFTVTDGSTPGQCTRSTDDCPSAPAAPTGLRVTASAINNVAVAWNPVSGASKYAVGYRENAASMWTEAADNITGTSYTLTSLDCGTAYDIGVRAVRVVANLPDIKGDWAETDLSAVSCEVFGSGTLQLGDTSSNAWQVPSGITDVYLDVALSDPVISDMNSGYIRVQELDYRGEYVDVKRVRTSADTSLLTGVSGGDTLRIKVDPDVFDDSAAEVYLTFHRGRGINTPVMAKATVQKQQRPNAPTNPTASVNGTSGDVTLSWATGSPRQSARPDHYEVSIVSVGSSPVKVHTDTNVTSTTLLISDGWGKGFAGALKADVRHCNSVGGCSTPLAINFTQAPFVVNLGFRDENNTGHTFANVEWEINQYGSVYLGDTGAAYLSNYQFQIEATDGTGFQAGRRACNWQSWPNGLSAWSDISVPIDTVRCSIGDESTNLKIWMKNKQTGLKFSRPSFQINPGKVWHIADEELTYSIDDDWITNPSTPISSDDEQTYTDSFVDAIAAWNALSTSGNSFSIAESPSSSTPDIEISGHQTPTNTSNDPCEYVDAVACVRKVRRTFPHMVTQVFHFDRQPHADMYNRTWTTNLSRAQNMSGTYLHMPLILAHEFGHAAGLAHSSVSDNTMYKFVVGVPPTGSNLLSSDDISALRRIYNVHRSHN